jgi:hypothetical protein
MRGQERNWPEQTDENDIDSDIDQLWLPNSQRPHVWTARSSGSESTDSSSSDDEVDTKKNNQDGAAAVSPGVGSAVGEYIGLSQARLLHIGTIS